MLRAVIIDFPLFVMKGLCNFDICCTKDMCLGFGR